ncbi:hypothetical protein [Mycobacterium sp.]|uniref:hypothetical protein n=1 Tax=Mycobacterium sp. TaxID=1785 RepID=UPI002BCA023E|nr:hypothetical protein [Mycobacterium sp.]HTQ22881.1 hypothetical protein [Mycobacterium sp.]
MLSRYLAIVEGRVKGLGGNPSHIAPSPWGTSGKPGPLHGSPPVLTGELEFTGKVSGVVYDHFGDFEGFLLETETSHERRFHSREQDLECLVREAWKEKTRISVFVNRERPHTPTRIILRRTARYFPH